MTKQEIKILTILLFVLIGFTLSLYLNANQVIGTILGFLVGIIISEKW